MGNVTLKPNCSGAGQKRQAGQALPEFIPLAIVLVPIFLLIPFLGKLADMNQTSIQAARYGAWERTVTSEFNKNDAQIQNEARKRFFGTNRVYIQTGDVPQEQDNQHSVLWRDQSGRRMLNQFTSANAQLPDRTIPSGVLNGGVRAMRTTLDITGRRDRWSVTDRGFYRSEFAVDVATNRLSGFDRGVNCAGQQNNADTYTCIRRHNVILADGWNSGTREMVTRRVERMLLTNAAAVPMARLSSLAGWMFPELRLLELGYVAPDVLPPDRIGAPISYTR